MRQHPADEIGDEVDAQGPAGAEIAEHPDEIGYAGEHHAAIGHGFREIERFVETGIQLKSGKLLEADIIITATGFNLSVLGDIDFVIDGKPLVFSDTVTYRGMMFTGVPNMAWVFGYFRASWTLRTDLVADFVCRLLKHMKEKGVGKVTPALRPEDHNMPILPWIDPENFNPGYMMRNMHLLPRRGDKPEWQHSQDYWTEKDEIPKTDLDDTVFVYR